MTSWTAVPATTLTALVFVVSAFCTKPAYQLVLASEVRWEQLNPARGKESPLARTLWGDRSGAGATGFLLRPADGFSSPPHIHNVSYRGIVIRGRFHNDDPGAQVLWMTAGAFWTQPKGSVHITAAQGKDALAYIEIENGPYRVLPVTDAFGSREQPIRMFEYQMPFVSMKGMRESVDGTRRASLWGSQQDDLPGGSLVQIPSGTGGIFRSLGAGLRAVVIRGRVRHRSMDETHARLLEPGSYFGSQGVVTHRILCAPPEACAVYVRSDRGFDFSPASPE